MFGTTDDILVVGYDDDGRDHDETVQKVLQSMQSFQMYTCPILWRGHFEKWSAARPTKNQGPYGHATFQ